MLKLSDRPLIHEVTEDRLRAYFRRPKIPGKRRPRRMEANFRILEWNTARSDWSPPPNKPLLELELDEDGVCYDYPQGQERVLNYYCVPLSNGHWHYAVIFVTLP